MLCESGFVSIAAEWWSGCCGRCRGCRYGEGPAALGWSWDPHRLLLEVMEAEGLPRLGHPALDAGAGVWCLVLLMMLLWPLPISLLTLGTLRHAPGFVFFCYYWRSKQTDVLCSPGPKVLVRLGMRDGFSPACLKRPYAKALKDFAGCCSKIHI